MHERDRALIPVFELNKLSYCAVRSRVHDEFLHRHIADHAAWVGMLANLAVQNGVLPEVQSIDDPRCERARRKPVGEAINTRQKLIDERLWERARIVDQDELLA